jgi:hypothetical protein
MFVRLLSLAFVLFAATPAFGLGAEAQRAEAAQKALVIQSFDATIDVREDGSLVVEEIIVPRFTGSWNGIFRTIPVEYETPQGLNYTLRLRVQSVTDGDGSELEYESSRERHYRKLKIWVPGFSRSTTSCTGT